ncbi:MAG: type II secretion system F family protein [Candidatus Aminicenantes bacterium]|nr:type II secretion system F family protein [Candidatus Aminicenantes bacterium]
MPYFLCRLATEEGKIISQSFLASSKEECRRYFEGEGFCVLSIKRDWRRLSWHGFLSPQRVKDKDFILVNQELIALLRAGYPALKCLEMVRQRVKNQTLQEILTQVENEVKGGKSLSEAFSPYENIFSKVYIASLLAGEQSGNLPGTLDRYVQYARIISQTKRRIRSALIYPSLLLFFSLGLMIILISFILPRFSSFYADFEAELPLVTRFIIVVADLLRRLLPAALFVLILVFLLVSRLKKNPRGARKVDRWKLKIPYAAIFWKEQAISLFSRTLGLLLEAGIPLLQSLPIAIQAVPNKFLAFSMLSVPEDIRHGQSLSDSLSRTGIFSDLSVDMIRIGETSANLPGMLKETAEVYDERIKGRIETLVNLIEPVIIIFMGVLVAIMLLSVYLPIFNIIRITR